MDFKTYINQIGFHIYHPHSELNGFETLSQLAAKRSNICFEIANTKLPEKIKETKEKLGPLCEIPRMSTFAIAAIINRGVSLIAEDTCFVNVGVWHGFTFLSAAIANESKHCIGVDNFSEFGGPKTEFLQRFERYKSPNHYFYEMDYVDYFAKIHRQPIGFYIYDGEHSYENQLKGLQIAEPFFAENCLVLVDDTNWEEPRSATLEFIKTSPNQYEIIFDRTTLANKHPTLWNGIMVFRKC